MQINCSDIKRAFDSNKDGKYKQDGDNIWTIYLHLASTFKPNGSLSSTYYIHVLFKVLPYCDVFNSHHTPDSKIPGFVLVFWKCPCPCPYRCHTDNWNCIYMNFYGLSNFLKNNYLFSWIVVWMRYKSKNNKTAIMFSLSKIIRSSREQRFIFHPLSLIDNIVVLPDEEKSETRSSNK